MLALESQICALNHKTDKLSEKIIDLQWDQRGEVRPKLARNFGQHLNVDDQVDNEP